MIRWDVYRQDAFDDAPPPGEGWEPFAATCKTGYNWDRQETAVGEVIWWRRRLEDGEAE